jgi:hypothetical protein
MQPPDLLSMTSFREDLGRVYSRNKKANSVDQSIAVARFMVVRGGREDETGRVKSRLESSLVIGSYMGVDTVVQSEWRYGGQCAFGQRCSAGRGGNYGREGLGYG